MSPESAIATGIVIGAIGVVGLYLAAHEADQTMSTVGLVVFTLAVAFEFSLIKRWFDYADRA